MTQDDRWKEHWQTAMRFVQVNRRNPSKFDGVEREIRNWIKHQKKLYNSDTLKEDRHEKFKELLALMEENRHKNQYE